MGGLSLFGWPLEQVLMLMLLFLQYLRTEMIKSLDRS